MSSFNIAQAAANTKIAARQTAQLNSAQKNDLLHAIADRIDNQVDAILSANTMDIQSAKEKQGYIRFHDCPIGWNATFGAFEFFIFGDEPSDEGIAHRIFYDCDDGATDWEISSRDFSINRT